MDPSDTYRFPIHLAGICLRAASSIGFDGQRVLAQAGINSEDLSNPSSYLSLDQIVHLTRASKRANRTGLPVAMAAARCISFSHLGMLGVAMVSAEDLLRALEVGVQFGGSYIPGLRLELRNEPELTTIFMRFDEALAEVSDVLAEGIIFGNRQLDRHFEHPIELRRVCFEHTSEYPRALYENYLGCPVEFGSDAPRIELGVKAGSVQSRCADQTTLEFASRQLRQQLQAQPTAASWRERVRRLWLSHADKGEFLSREQIAKRLALGPKTLARRLAEEGTGYRELLQDTRMQLAMDLIRDSDLPPAEVGRRVGFHSEAAFYRAFKQWTSSTPTRIRRGCESR